MLVWQAVKTKRTATKYGFMLPLKQFSMVHQFVASEL